MRGRVKRTTFEGWIEEDLEKIGGCAPLDWPERLTFDSRLADIVCLPDGRSSLVPSVRKIFEERFGAEKISSGSEFTSVAKGLALRALDT